MDLKAKELFFKGEILCQDVHQVLFAHVFTIQCLDNMDNGYLAPGHVML